MRVNGRGNIGTLVQIIPPPFCYAPSILTRNELDICEVLKILICPFSNMIGKFCQYKVLIVFGSIIEIVVKLNQRSQV